MKLNSKGQSLIEVLAGLTMAVLIVAALVNMVTASLRSSQYAKTSAQATKYAQEAIEWLRSERDLSPSWSEFKTKVMGGDDVEMATWCLTNVTCEFPAIARVCNEEEYINFGDCLTGNENSIFKRELIITNNVDLEYRINVKVRVYWSDQASQEHSSELNTILSDTERWR